MPRALEDDDDEIDALWRARPDWHARAACRASPRALFFEPDLPPHTGRRSPAARADEAAALATCATCDVRFECLEYALTTHIEYGVWGATTGADRRRMISAQQAG